MRSPLKTCPMNCRSAGRAEWRDINGTALANRGTKAGLDWNVQTTSAWYCSIRHGSNSIGRARMHKRPAHDYCNMGGVERLCITGVVERLCITSGSWHGLGNFIVYLGNRMTLVSLVNKIWNSLAVALLVTEVPDVNNRGCTIVQVVTISQFLSVLVSLSKPIPETN